MKGIGDSPMVRAWQALDPALDDLKLQVNLSGADLTHAALYDRVERVLRHNAFPPQQLTLELTENILMERLEGALSTLESLRCAFLAAGAWVAATSICASAARWHPRSPAARPRHWASSRRNSAFTSLRKWWPKTPS